MGETAQGRVLQGAARPRRRSRWPAPTTRTAPRSQFFIVFKDSNFLDGQYTVWGKVTSGMEFVDKIKKGAPGSAPMSARRTR